MREYEIRIASSNFSSSTTTDADIYQHKEIIQAVSTQQARQKAAVIVQNLPSTGLTSEVFSWEIRLLKTP